MLNLNQFKLLLTLAVTRVVSFLTSKSQEVTKFKLDVTIFVLFAGIIVAHCDVKLGTGGAVTLHGAPYPE